MQTAIMHTLGEQLRSLQAWHADHERLELEGCQAMTQPLICSVLFEWVATNRTDGPVVVVVVVGVGVRVGVGVGGVVVVVG